MGVAVLKCGKCCGDAGSQCSVIDVIANVLPAWGVIFLSEVDALRQDLPSNDYSVHSSFRHWPGEGSFAMMFIVRRCFRRFVKKFRWRGRCGALHLFQRDPVAGNHTNVYIIGVHAPHGDLQIDTFSDIACLLRERPWGSKVLVAGDWNVDQLPSLSNDPWSDQPGREMHHVAERLL